MIPAIRPAREIDGISAVLLPWTDGGASVDWDGFESHLTRTLEAGLAPAVNMDTGYVQLLDEPARREVLDRTNALVAGGRFVAGAWVGDEPGAAFAPDRYRAELEAITAAGGTPIVFPSHGLAAAPDGVVAAHEELARDVDAFLAFELSPAFTPAGRIYDLETFAGLLDLPACVGAKHSSLSRVLEWQRLRLRDERRPDFLVLTGNDLGIDMVMYGSDYLLGLSTFAPDLFAARDRMWAAGDPGFYELNDALQYLGFFAFRGPVPAYKHSAAMFLKLRGWIGCDATHPQSPRRPDADREVLVELLGRLGV